MENEFPIIDEFLRNFTPEVEGRSVDSLTPELCDLLSKLGRGELDDDARKKVARELLANPAAMEFLVAEAKKNA
jgi:hypothetical protein